MLTTLCPNPRMGSTIQDNPRMGSTIQQERPITHASAQSEETSRRHRRCQIPGRVAGEWCLVEVQEGGAGGEDTEEVEGVFGRLVERNES